jgi:hypothetical protein
VCDGLDFMLQSMKVGGKRWVIVPPELRFGETGADLSSGGWIPSQATLEYIVQLQRAPIAPSWYCREPPERSNHPCFPLGSISLQVNPVKQAMLPYIESMINAQIVHLESCTVLCSDFHWPLSRPKLWDEMP